MESNKNKAFPLLLLVMLLSSLGLNYYLYDQHKAVVATDAVKIDSLVEVRVELSSELTQTSLDLNKYKGLSAKLDSLLGTANEKIASREAKIKQLLATEKDIKVLNQKLKEELAELKLMKEQYLETIDQLIKENDKLKYDNKALNNSLNEVMTENLDLFKKVKTAENLKAEYIKVGTFKKKNNGKYIETAIAKRTNKIDVGFSILENKVARPGKKTVYLRLVTPDGLPLGNRSGGSGTFKKLGTEEEVLFTVSQEVDFNNEKVDLVLSYEEAQRIFSSGTYIVEIYIDGIPAAVSSFNLK